MNTQNGGKTGVWRYRLLQLFRERGGEPFTARMALEYFFPEMSPRTVHYLLTTMLRRGDLYIARREPFGDSTVRYTRWYGCVVRG